MTDSVASSLSFVYLFHMEKQESAKRTSEQSPDGWSGIATSYETIFQKFTVQFAEKAAELLDIKSGERVIDVAAGTGAFSFIAAQRGARVLATDFAPGMIAGLDQRIARESVPNIRTAVMDGQALAVPDASFDVSVSVLGIIFFPDINKGLSELRRVLVPGGRVGIVCWGTPATSEFKNLIKSAVSTAVPDFAFPQNAPVWARLAGEDSLSRHLSQAGFQDVKITTVTGQLEIDNPESFWHDFVKPGPAQAELWSNFTPGQLDRIGQALIDAIRERRQDGNTGLVSEACIGIGTR